MSITVGGRSCDGPLTSAAGAKELPGVYLVLCRQTHRYSVLEVGESANVKQSLEERQGQPAWSVACPGQVVFAAYYGPELGQAARARIAGELRERFVLRVDAVWAVSRARGRTLTSR
jgi:hypothetical protein